MRERIDLSVYVRALGVFARNPTVIVVPLLAMIVGVFVGEVSGVQGGGALGGFTTSIVGFILLLLQIFSLGVAIIIGDAGWRRGTASFDAAWQEARAKSRDIVFAAFGLTFVFTIAQYAGSIVGFGTILMAIAAYGLIYTVAAAAIGGVPGGAAIGASVERVKSGPIAAAILTVVTIVLVFFFGSFIGVWIDQWLLGALGGTSIVAAIVDALLRSIFIGYVGIVMAKVYADASFSPPRW